MADETIKLNLDMGQSGAEVQKVEQKVEDLGDAARKAATSADGLAASTAKVDAAAAPAVRTMKEAAREAEQLEAGARRGAGGVEELAEATGKAAGSSGSAARSMLELGRGVQDFQAAGFNGIVNNIEGLARALGLGAGVAGAATIAGVAFQSLLPQIKSFFESISGGDKATEAVATATAKLTEAADKLRAKLAELKAEATARLQQMEAENAAIERQVRLEEQRAADRARHAKEETERRRAAVAMEGAPTLEEQRRRPTEKARADELKQIIGGDPEGKLIRERAEAASAPTRAQEIEAIARALRDEMDRVAKSGGSFAPQVHRRLRADLAALQAGAAGNLSIANVVGNLSPQSQALVSAARQRAAAAGHERADELLGRFYAGDAAAIGQVHGMLPEGTLRDQLYDLTPAGHRARLGRNVGQTLEGFGRRVRDKAAADAAKRQKEHDKEVAKLEEEYSALGDDLEDAGHHDRAARAREVAKLEEEYSALGDDLAGAGRHDDAAKVKEQVRLGHKVGEAAAKAAPKAIPAADKLPLLHPDATAAELDQAMLANQQQLTQNVAQLQRQLDEARRIGQANRRIGQQLRQPQTDIGAP